MVTKQLENELKITWDQASEMATDRNTWKKQCTYSVYLANSINRVSLSNTSDICVFDVYKIFRTIFLCILFIFQKRSFSIT